jgi:Glycosyltransferase like family 2/Glycosyl transferase family 2
MVTWDPADPQRIDPAARPGAEVVVVRAGEPIALVGLPSMPGADQPSVATELRRRGHTAIVAAELRDAVRLRFGESDAPALDVTVVAREVGRGRERAANAALAACTTPLLALVDDDAHPGDDTLRRLVAPFVNPVVVATTGPALPARGRPALTPRERACLRAHIVGTRTDWITGDWKSLALMTGGGILCVRADAVREVGGFVDRDPTAALTLCRLVAASGRVVGVAGAAVARSRPGPDLPRGTRAAMVLRHGRRPRAAATKPGRLPAFPAPPTQPSAHPDLSVIIPTTPARAAALAECLAALNDQSLSRAAYEVIVVLNGRSPVSAIDAPGADRVEQLPEPSAAAARNHGAGVARAPWLVFVDDDVLLDHGALAAHLDALRDGCGVSMGPYYPEPDASPTGAIATLWWHDHFARKARPGHVMSFVDLVTGNTGIARDVFLAAGGLDRTFPGAHREDWELGVRLLANGVRFTATPAAAGVHRHRLSVEKYVRDRTVQGPGDIALLARHPTTGGALTLGQVGSLPRAVWRPIVTAGVLATSPRAVAGVGKALDGLARMGGGRLSIRLIRGLALLGYCRAIRDRPQGDTAPHDIRLELASGGPPVAPPVGGVELTWHGHRLGRVALPNGQWDAEHIATEAGRTMAERFASLRDADEAAGVPRHAAYERAS